ncbi:MAG: UMP kinase [Clostridia bacterium]|nr:UMP kinase [Clostridia bacterium]
MAINDTPKYKRVLLKLSGEALSDRSGKDILDHAMLDEVAQVIKKALEKKVEVAIIVGAGNIWRGRQGSDMDRVRADHMGMLATTINCIAVEDALRRAGICAHVMSAVTIESFTERFDRRKAIEALEQGEVVIFAAGLGMPFVSTDTAAAVRAAEIGADMILFAKNIDGVYSADPKTDPNAVHYDRVTYDFILEKNLKVMDQTAASFCRENKLDMLVFALEKPENILDALTGSIPGTVVTVE